jgi:hypothetical protein
MSTVMTVFVFLVVAMSPWLLVDRASGVLMEALATKLGTAMTHTDDLGVAALLDNWRQALEL